MVSLKEQIEKMDMVDACMHLHEILKAHLINSDFEKVSEVMTMFNDDATDINLLKTILLICNSFKSNPDICKIYDNILNIYKIKSVNAD